MYHRFHAPHDLRLEHVTYLSGDTWNVNPIALARVQRLFCRNERAVLRLRLAAAATPLALVPVAAILVASIRLHSLDVLLHLRWRGPQRDALRRAGAKGQETGLVRARLDDHRLRARGFRLAPGIEPGTASAWARR
jgi:phosphatidylserine decarboxylase